ncbi:MAG: amidohydrolase family protein [Desulfomonilaceae bacterium]
MNLQLHQAGWVAVSPQVWIEGGAVEIIGGRIASVRKPRPGDVAIDHGPGVIMPALVNAHTHLSLSTLAGKIRCDQRYVEWVKQLIQLRTCVSPEDVTGAAVQAAKSAKLGGTGTIAEVGPLEPGTTAIANSDLEGIVFSEFLGNDPAALNLPDDRSGISYSYAGHALHTTSPEVLRALKSASTERGSVFSLHLAESEAETEFLATGQGDWSNLLESRGIEFSGWDLRDERPVARAERLGLLGPGTLAVHLLDVTPKEIETLCESGVRVCVCPRSNLSLHGKLPNIEAFLTAGLTVALGTDSLLSSPSLDMFDEMSFVASRYPALEPETILSMATANGATALGVPDPGTISAGNRARLIYVDLEANSSQIAASKLVSGEFQGVQWI